MVTPKRARAPRGDRPRVPPTPSRAGRVRDNGPVIPLPVILCELMVGMGAALFAGSLLAFLKLRREDNWPPARPSSDATTAVPSRVRVLGGLAAGLVIALWGVATFVAEGYQF